MRARIGFSRRARRPRRSRGARSPPTSSPSRRRVHHAAARPGSPVTDDPAPSAGRKGSGCDRANGGDGGEGGTYLVATVGEGGGHAGGDGGEDASWRAAGGVVGRPPLQPAIEH